MSQLSIKNKVADSPLVLVELSDFYNKEISRVGYDMRQHLFQDAILREKDFRNSLKEMDWSIYRGKIVYIYCSVEAIIPLWAYFLIASYLKPVCHFSGCGTKKSVDTIYLIDQIQKIDPEVFNSKKVVIKGCTDIDVEENAYLALVSKLLPVVSSIMFGEPCSTVPVFKRKL